MAAARILDSQAVESKRPRRHTRALQIDRRRKASAEDLAGYSPVASTTVPYSNQVDAMFGEGHHDSIVQPGIDEALACRDMLQPAPVRPSLLSRVIACIVPATHSLTHRDPMGARRVRLAPLHRSRQGCRACGGAHDSKTTGRFIMRRFARSLVVVMLLLGLAAAPGQTVIAQDATADAMNAMASHSVVGTWQQHDLEGLAATGFVVFHADGTVVATSSYRGVRLGIWRPTGERTAELVLIEMLLIGGDPSLTPEGEETGTITYRETVTIDETGNRLSFDGIYDTRDASLDPLRGPLSFGSLTLAPATRVTFDQVPATDSTMPTTPAA